MAKVVVTGKIPAGGLARLKAEHDVLAWESDEAYLTIIVIKIK